MFCRPGPVQMRQRRPLRSFGLLLTDCRRRPGPADQLLFETPSLPPWAKGLRGLTTAAYFRRVLIPDKADRSRAAEVAEFQGIAHQITRRLVTA